MHVDLHFTPAELAVLQKHPLALALLMDYHEVCQLEADAVWGYDDIRPTGNERRKQALYERGRSIMAEDLDLWDDKTRKAFGFPPGDF